MPFTDKQIVNLVKRGVRQEMKADTATRKAITDLITQGVATELRAPIGTTGITPAQAAVNVRDALAALTTLQQQVTELTALVATMKAQVTALSEASHAPAGTQSMAGSKTPARTRTATSTRTPARTRTSAGTGAASSDGRG